MNQDKTIRRWMMKGAGFLALACAYAFPLGNLHPAITIKHILPSALNAVEGIGGIDLFENGDGVICTWGGSQQPPGKSSSSNGEVWIIPNLASGTPGTPVRVATGLREPLGVKVVGADFYVMEKPRIAKFTGSGANWTKSTLWSLPTAWYNDGQWHHFSFNLILKDNHFWFTTGTAYDYTAADPIQRGALIKVPLAGGSFTQLARGLRNPEGLALGPEGEFFATENQGHWKPVNVLYHLPVTNVPANGRFYGFRTTGNNSCGTTAPAVDGSSCPADPEYPPAVYMPYGAFSNSPTRPILLKKGPYAGQMIVGDVFKGGTFRFFLEKMGTDYQGAAFNFTTAGSAGFNYGVHQFLETPTGTLLSTGVGGGTCNLGGSNNWNWNNTCRGLSEITLTEESAFEILAIRALVDGFELEFTKPVNATAAAAPGNYQVRTTVITPVQAYGQDASASDNNIAVAVQSATPSPDGLRVKLQLASFLPRRMYAITLNNSVTSATGQQAYTNVGYYTLNKVGPATPPTKLAYAGYNKPIGITVNGGAASIAIPFSDPYRLGLFALDGRKVGGIEGTAPGTLRTENLKAGIYLLSGTVKGASYQGKVRIP